MPLKKVKRKSIHFHFAPHPPGERYLPKELSTRTKSHLYEMADGRSANYQSNESRINRTRNVYLRKIARRGQVMAGEEDLFGEDLHWFPETWADRIELTYAHPTVSTIQDYFIFTARWYKLRHEKILANVDYLSEEKMLPLTARYGGLHSLLSSTLGKRASRTISPQVFSFESEVTRRLMRGQDPESISSLDYKRAFVTALAENHRDLMYALSGKAIEKLTAKDYLRASLILRTMIGRLNEEKLNEILHRKNVDLIWQANGFTNLIGRDATRAKLDRFLQKYSLFSKQMKWQRKNKKEWKGK